MKYIWMIASVLLIGFLGYMLIPSDTVNKLARKQIEFIDGNYTVTYSQDSVTKIYNVKSGKITSTDKGYYFFWADTINGNKYRQTPIDKTLIEEI